MLPSLCLTIFIVCADAELTLLRHASKLYCVSSGEEQRRYSPALAWTYPLSSTVRNESISWMPKIPESQTFNLNYRTFILEEDASARPQNERGFIDQPSFELSNIPPHVTDHRWNDFRTTVLLAGQTKKLVLNANKRRLNLSFSVLVHENLSISLHSHDNTVRENYFRLLIDTGSPHRRELQWCEVKCDRFEENCDACEVLQQINGTLLFGGNRWTTLRLTYEEEGRTGSKLTLHSDLHKDTWTSSKRLQRVAIIRISQNSTTIGFLRPHNYRVKTMQLLSAIYGNDLQSARNMSLCLAVTYVSPERESKLELIVLSDSTMPRMTMKLPITDEWRTERNIFQLTERKRYTLSFTTNSDNFMLGDLRVCSENEIRVSKLQGDEIATCTNLVSKQNATLLPITGSEISSFVCPIGQFGENCDLSCSNIVDGVSSCRGITACSLSSCSCLTGFMGRDCDQACPIMTYGAGCQNCGHCKNNAACNSVNGKCDGCAPGWVGEKCDKQCIAGTFGAECKLSCSYCKDGVPCDHVTGHCPQDCAAGYTGETCQIPCSPGTFGVNCQLRCHCMNDTVCDSVSGNCANDTCADGWTGNSCQSKCENGFYGPGCQLKCGNCKELSDCDHISGKCFEGCKEGWTSDNCDLGCEIGTYGQDCKWECGHCRNTLECNPISGYCPDDCADGWIGEKCDETCKPGTYGHECKKQCGQCKNNTICLASNGSCPNGCADKFDGVLCLHSTMKSTMDPAFVIIICVLVITVIATIIGASLYIMKVKKRERASVVKMAMHVLTTPRLPRNEIRQNIQVYDDVLNVEELSVASYAYVDPQPSAVMSIPNRLTRENPYDEIQEERDNQEQARIPNRPSRIEYSEIIFNTDPANRERLDTPKFDKKEPDSKGYLQILPVEVQSTQNDGGSIIDDDTIRKAKKKRNTWKL